MTTRIHSKEKPRKVHAADRRRQENLRNIVMLDAGVALILVAVFWLLLANPYVQSSGPVRIGSALQNFSLTDMNGKAVHLNDFQGKIILINAWATWCPPCKAEMPLLNRYFQSHMQDGFVLLAINAGDTREETVSYASQTGLAFPVLLDPGARQLGSMAIDSFPTSILVGRDGKVKSIHAGEYTNESLDAEVTPLLRQ